MKVNITENINRVQSINKLLVKNVLEFRDIKHPQGQEINQNPSDTYEGLKYNDQTSIYDLMVLEKIKNESENLYEKLRDMVEDTILEQAKVETILEKEENTGIEKTKMIEIKELLSAKGELGKETISEKIVEFIKEASGNEEKKITVLIKAVDKGFENAEKTLGELPVISTKTYEMIITKLKNYIIRERLKNESENLEIQMFWARLFNPFFKENNKGRVDTKVYLMIILISLVLYYGIRIF